MSASANGESPLGTLDQHEGTDLFEDTGFVLTRSFLWVLLGAFIVFAGSAVILAWFFHMDVSVKGEGMLAPAVRHKVKSAVTGIVSEVHVTSGAVVRAGDRLVSLDDREWRSQLKRVDDEIAIVSSRLQRLRTRLDSDLRIAGEEMAVAQVEVDRAALEVRRVRLEHSAADEVTARLLGWHRGPVDELIPVQRVQGVLEYKKALWKLAATRKWAHDDRERELEELGSELDKWEEERQRLMRKIEQTLLFSPLDGVVLTAKLEERQGDRVEAGETVVEVADARAWVVETDIAETDIPRVRLGHSARIEVSGFPHMEYEMLHGQVTRIGVQPTSAGYSVRIALRQTTINDFERSHELFTGMTATVRIVVDSGPILELLWRAASRGLAGVDTGAMRLGVNTA